MAEPVRIPQLGLTMDGGTVVAWRAADGQAVKVGQVLYELETEKAVLEVEAEAEGYLRSPRAQEGEYVLVGTLVAWITATPDEPLPSDTEPAAGRPAGGGEAVAAAPETATPDEPLPSDTQPAAGRPAGGGEAVATAPETAAPGAAAPAGGTAVAAGGPPPDGTRAAGDVGAGRPRSSPFARSTARRLGVDWRRLAGSGPGGRVVARDVEAAASRASGRTPNVREATAQRMSLSAAIPQFAVARVVDFSLPRQARARAEGPVRISYTDFLLQGALVALAQVPQLHASYRDGGTVRHAEPAIGLAVATEAGLLVPVLRPGFGATLAALAAARAAMVERARTGRLSAGDWGDPTFVVSNLGPFGVDRFQALLDPAAGAILAAGAVRDRAVVRDGGLAVAPCCEISLTVDHRLADGAEAARFLDVLAAYCERGEGMRTH